MKKVLSVILVLSVLFALGACSLFGGNKETTAPATGNQGDAQGTTAPKENPNAPKMHTVTVTDETGKGLANVVVQISSADDESVAGGPTDENGVFSEELLKDESYIITLMMVPKGYVAEESYTFTDMEANIVLQPNVPKMHTVTVTDENGKGLAGVVVTISSDDDESVAGGPTDENGVFSEELLKNESYIIKVMMVPNGYVAQESYTFTDMEANIVLQPAEAAE